MTDAILTLNAGSSSLKFALFGADGTGSLDLALRGEIEEIATDPHFTARDANGAVLADQRWPEAAENVEPLFEKVIDWIDAHVGNDRLVAIGFDGQFGSILWTSAAPAQAPEGVRSSLILAFLPTRSRR